MEKENSENNETLKDKFFVNGNIFRFSNNTWYMVWYGKLINKHGYMPEKELSEDLRDTDCVYENVVVEVYAPNNYAGYLDELICPEPRMDVQPIWVRAGISLVNISEIKEAFNIPMENKIFVIGK